MSITSNLLEGVIVMLAIISLVVLLKKVRIVKKEDSLLFSRIVLKVTLPALIFSSLATKEFNSTFIIMAGIMAVIEIAIIILAWVIGTILKLERGVKGALILVSAFGMTTMLGYPLIRQVFHNDPLAMQEAVVTSEFGVGLLLFIFGPLIAMYYGESKIEGKVIFSSVKNFFISPIFISLVAGIGISFLKLSTENQIFATAISFFELIGNANLFMVAITIGLIIEFKKVKNIYLFLAIAIILKLILKPLLALWFTTNPDYTDMMSQIVVIETALPSAILTAVFAKQYNCRPDLVSLAIMISLVISVITISSLFLIFY